MMKRERERRLAAVEANAPALADPLDGLSYEELKARRAALVAEIAAELRRTGRNMAWWIAEHGTGLADELAAILEPGPNTCSVCFSREHIVGSIPHVLDDGSAPTWPFELKETL